MSKISDTLLKLMGYNVYPKDKDDDVATMNVTKYDKDVKPENPMTFSTGARKYLHLFVEIFLVQHFTAAQMVAIQCKRKTLMLSDLRIPAFVSGIGAPKLF